MLTASPASPTAAGAGAAAAAHIKGAEGSTGSSTPKSPKPPDGSPSGRPHPKKGQVKESLASKEANAAAVMPLDELRRTFDGFDTDRSGELDLAEIQRACKKLGVKCTDNSAKKVFKSLDSDGSGFISWPEFLDFFCKVSDPDELKGLLAAHNQRFFDYKTRVKADPKFSLEFPNPPSAPMLANFRGHNSDVVSICWLSEERLVSCSLDGAILEWNALARSANPGPLKTSVVPDETSIYCMDAIRGGKNLLIGMGSGTQTLGLWSLSDQSFVKKYAAHDKKVHSCAMSLDGNTGAAGDQAGCLTLNDIERAEIVARWSVHDNIITKCNFNKTGQRICTSSRDGHVKIFDLAMKDFAAITIEDASSSETVNSVLWCKEHEVICAGDDFCIKRYDVRKAKGPPVASYMGHTSRVLSLALSSRGDYVVSGAGDGTVRCWEVDGDAKLAAALQPKAKEINDEIEKLDEQCETMQEKVWSGECDMKELQQKKEKLEALRNDLERIDAAIAKSNTALETVKAKLDLNSHKSAVAALAWCDTGEDKALLASGGSDQFVQLADVDLLGCTGPSTSALASTAFARENKRISIDQADG